MVESAKKTNEDLKRQKEGIEKQIEKYKARCETMRKIIKSGDERPKKRLKKVELEIKKLKEELKRINEKISKNMAENKEQKKQTKENEEKKKEQKEKIKEDDKKIEEENVKTKKSNKLDEELQQYTELIQKGFKPDSTEMINFFREICEKRKLKSEKTQKAKEKNNADMNSNIVDEELQQYAELIQKGFKPDSTEMINFFKEICKKREQKLKNNYQENNTKYPLDIIKKNELDVVKKNELDVIKKNEIAVKPNDDLKEKLKIEYNGKKNVYRVNNLKEEIKAINFKNKKQKIQYIYNKFTTDEINEIFGNEKMMKKIARKCDPQLLVILADNNMNYASEYIEKLINSKEDVKNKLPYEMKYNLKGMRRNYKNNKMSLFQRIRVNNMARRNRNVAEYIPDDRSRGWLAIPFIGILLAGGLATAEETNKQIKPTDRTQHITDIYNKKTEIEKPNKEIDDDEIKENIEGLINEEQEKYNGDLVLGSKVTLPDGLTYTEDSQGNGRTAKIGEFSWRPAGEYTIDRVALYYNGNLINNIGNPGSNIDEIVKEYANKLGIDKSMISQKAHVCLADGHEGPTGWLNMEEMSIDELKSNISKTYDEIQQEKAAQQTQAQKSTQQQNHENR